MRIKTWLSTLCAGLLLAISASTVWAAETKRVVKVGVYDNPPKVFRGDSGRAEGLFPDLLNYIAEKENWQIEYVFGTWDEGLSRLERGEINLMVDVAYSDERAAKYDFTNTTVFNSWGVVYAKKSSRIESFKDLNDKKVAILKTGIYFQGSEGIIKYIDAFGLKVEFIDVNEYKEVFDLVSQGRADAAVVSRIFGLANESLYPDLKSTNIFFSPTELRFALTKGGADNPYLISRLDYWVDRLKQGYEGVYVQSLKVHGLLGLLPQKEVVPSWVIWLGTATGGVVLVLIFANLILGRAKTTAMAELRRNEKMLRQVIGNVPVAIFSIDSGGVVTLVEGEVAEKLGYAPEKLVGKSVFVLFKDDRNIIENVTLALSGREVNFKSQFSGKTLRVDLKPVSESANRFRIDGVAVDITEEAKLEREKSTFVTLVSHHLRTPPTVIKWSMELLSQKITPILNEEGLKLWRGMEQANNKMIDLANSLSKSTRAALKAESIDDTEWFDIKNLMESVKGVEPEGQPKG